MIKFVIDLLWIWTFGFAIVYICRKYIKDQTIALWTCAFMASLVTLLLLYFN